MATRNLSTIMSAYNHCRHNPNMGRVDAGRKNRALGLVMAGKVDLRKDGAAYVMSGNTEDKFYFVHPDKGCNCPDAYWGAKHVFGKPACKHQMAAWILARANLLESAPAAETQAA